VNAEERLSSIYEAIASSGIRALVMGGHAVRFYGVERTTYDFHLVHPDWENHVRSGNVSEIVHLDRLAEAVYRIGKPAIPAIDWAIEQGRSDLRFLRACILEPGRYLVTDEGWLDPRPPTP
jgi:hypothetical protein